MAKNQGSKGQLSTANLTSSQTGIKIGEGYERLQTSGGNLLTFNGPAEKYAYLINHPSQFVNNGEWSERTQTPAV